MSFDSKSSCDLINCMESSLNEELQASMRAEPDNRYLNITLDRETDTSLIKFIAIQNGYIPYDFFALDDYESLSTNEKWKGVLKFDDCSVHRVDDDDVLVIKNDQDKSLVSQILKELKSKDEEDKREYFADSWDSMLEKKGFNMKNGPHCFELDYVIKSIGVTIKKRGIRSKAVSDISINGHAFIYQIQENINRFFCLTNSIDKSLRSLGIQFESSVNIAYGESV